MQIGQASVQVNLQVQRQIIQKYSLVKTCLKLTSILHHVWFTVRYDRIILMNCTSTVDFNSSARKRSMECGGYVGVETGERKIANKDRYVQVQKCLLQGGSCMISGFCSGVNEICALLGFYTAVQTA